MGIAADRIHACWRCRCDVPVRVLVLGGVAQRQAEPEAKREEVDADSCQFIGTRNRLREGGGP